ncbi:hypothetical protein MAR_017972 [Mya arenaria]|uniref:Secreted protein n=1 Tax=Mya arenaria TaxID=6604 RepID=A0ABY7EHY8_MYAAR|nr:hypothetical protein MAR_017972 [Mya arenaria]
MSLIPCFTLAAYPHLISLLAVIFLINYCALRDVVIKSECMIRFIIVTDKHSKSGAASETRYQTEATPLKPGAASKRSYARELFNRCTALRDRFSVAPRRPPDSILFD